ncbi:DUF3857 domain-containing protein [Flavobacterium sp.]|uniref:DUF3857 domain-containing protein n=1 Tax=Flavobacterium sp. TaxID=239 RepID=UPI0026310A8A|nr:DUF3857 domain-containing protein [Flavobacterium sp.]
MKENKNLLIIIAFFLNALFLNAQESILKKYNWDEKNTSINIPDIYKSENEVILDKTVKIELINENKVAKQYFLLHQKVYVNSDDAVNKYNKIYIPFSEDEKLLVTKARVILSNGKIINLNTKDIKEEIDEEKEMKYNYFAVTGLEKGAVLEEIFLFEQVPDLNGKTIKIQTEQPIGNLNFELIYPNHLVFKTKNYNGLSEPVIDNEKLKDQNASILTIQEKNISGLIDDDKFSNWNNSIKMFRYKLDENTANGAKNMYNFKTFSSNVYENLYKELDKKSVRDIEDFFKNVPKSNNQEENIWNIENKIKKTIIYNSYFDNKENLSDIIKSKQANQSDIIKLYLAAFNSFKIEHNIVFTSNRFEIPFDKDFESYENLNDILFYFPIVNKYLSPTNPTYRFPLFPSENGDTNGLFIKTKEYSGVKMGYGEIEMIKLPDTSLTEDLMDITIDFTKDLQNPLITTKIQFGGYSNINIQPIKDYVPAEDYKNILKEIAENYTGSKEFKSLETKNDGLDFIGKKPFTIEVTFDGKDLIQKAGPNFLFSAGLTIGKQTELYQEGTRKTPVEIDYPHAYKRNVKLILPENVTVKNLEKFDLSFETKINDKVEAAFYSKHSKNGNIINVENTEFYNITKYPLDKFESYKDVINAAADFNKVIIILSKN